MNDETAATNAAGEPIAPESQVAESAPAGNEPAAPEKDGFTKRIDELTKNWRETERDRDDAKRRADEAARDAQYWRDQALRAHQPAPQTSQPETVVAKTLADFEYDEGKYQSYLFEQAERRAVAAAEKRLKEQQEIETKERRRTQFLQRESAFEKDNPDYRSKTRSLGFPVSDAMAEVCAESDEGPAVLYYLANNIDLAEQISRMPPLATARELGRIEAKLISAREQAAKKVSDAPPPTPKLEGTGDPTPRPSTTSPESDKLSDDEWVKAERQRLARKQKRASQ